MSEDHKPHGETTVASPANTDTGSTASEPENAGSSRRDFLKETLTGAAGAVSLKQLIGGAVGAAALGVATYAGLKVNGTPQDEFPVPVKPDYKPVDQRNMLWTFVASKKLNEQHPERTEKFDGFNFHEKVRTTYKRGPVRDEPGYSQIDRALGDAGWEANHHLAPGEQYGQPNTGIFTWDQSDVAPTQYQFKTKEEAALAIKSAARVFNATRCGITQRDRRWDYNPLYDVNNDRELSWEKDFPFEPKTVIVLLVEMDYQCVKASPSWTSNGTVGEGYSMMCKVAGQLAKFLRLLGYHAVASQNDLGMSVPYAIAAGLGEGARNGSLIAPFLGNRHRIGKVYTDLEFVAYDKPRTFGYADFCMNCKICAEYCPGEAISFEDKPTWGPTYDKADDPDYAYHANSGVLKWHNDAKKCLKFWIENDDGCTNCITTCVYNKPDVWHHVFIDGLSHISPGWVHGIMRDLDHVFGYGTVSDEQDVKDFWVSGKTMRGGKTA